MAKPTKKPSPKSEYKAPVADDEAGSEPVDLTTESGIEQAFSDGSIDLQTRDRALGRIGKSPFGSEYNEPNPKKKK